MSVITVDFATRQRGTAPRTPELPQVAWWHCPSFCDPDLCYGGHSHGDVRYSSSRTHAASTFNATVRDAGDEDVTVVVNATVAEDIDLGYWEPLVEIEVAGSEITVTLDDAERLAAAILAAVALGGQALPTITRSLPYAGGGRDSNHPEAS